jgi:2-polyprenyl-3-methyl-5-hydroxy-6-metoxy-1,4-benzoquinol methylase
MAWRHYAGAPRLVRILMTLRPRICPLDVLAEAVPERARVLDVGCGAGVFLEWLARSRALAEGVGVDMSAPAIATARACAEAGSPLRFEVCGAGDAWPAGPFDMVTLVDVLHHVPREEQRAFIGRLRPMRTDRVLVKDIDPRPRWKAWMNALHDFLMTRQRVNLRAMPEVVAWLREDGFRIMRAERVDRLWYGHYLIVAERAAASGASEKAV